MIWFVCIHFIDIYKHKFNDNNEMEFVTAKMGGKVGVLGGEYQVRLSAVKGKHGVMEYDVGVGAGTSVGIVDDSLKLKVLGTGISIGKKTNVSLFGTTFGFNFGN